MDISHVLAAIRRRWSIVVVLLLATSGAAAWVYTTVPSAYQSQATMIVLLPNENSDGSSEGSYPVNPYLNVGAASSQVAASALASISTSEEFQTGLEADGVTSGTSVEVAAYGGGVVLILTATGDDAEAVRSDLSVVSSRISAELAQRQTDAGAPDGTFLTASDLTGASPASVLSGDRNKLAAVTGIIGLLDTVAAVLVAETIGRRRAAKRGRATAPPAEAGETGGHRRPRGPGTAGPGVDVATQERPARDGTALDELARLGDMDGLERPTVAASARGSGRERDDSGD